jgi:hypothetical protein
MPLVLTDIFSLIGFLLRVIGFLVVGWALGRLVFERFNTGSWQLEIAYILGLFGLLIAAMAFTSAGSAGAFALGVGIAYFTMFVQGKESRRDTEPPKTD